MNTKDETQNEESPAETPDCEPVYRWTADSKIVRECA